MPTPIVIEDAWKRYAALIMPADASEDQKVECRRAFFGGAQALFIGITNCISPGEDPTTADMAMLERLRDELETFGSAVGTPAETAAATEKHKGLPPFEIDIEEHQRKGIVKLTITWRDYDRRELTPKGSLFFVPRVCEAVAQHFRANAHLAKLDWVASPKGGSA